MNWRETARSPKLLFLDARTLIPLFIFMFHMRLWTFSLAIVGVGLFAVLERLGYDLNVLFNLARTRMIEKKRPINSPLIWRLRCRM